MYLIYGSEPEQTKDAARLIGAAGFTSRWFGASDPPRFAWRPLDPAQPIEPLGDLSGLPEDLIRRLVAERSRVETQLAHLTERLGPGAGQVMVDPERTALWAGRAREITSVDVATAMGESPWAKFNLFFLDRKLWVISEEHWREIIAETQVDAVRYVPERTDCEDYAKAFSGLASLRYGVNSAGIVIDTAGKHSYNLLVVDVGGSVEIRAFEPQTDDMVDERVGSKPYCADQGYAIF